MTENTPKTQENTSVPVQQPSNSKKEKGAWDETIRTMLYALVIALLFRSFLFEPFHIPSGSMKETLLVGDYLFVSKYEYGYSRYSFPFGFRWFDGRIGSDNRPERGDIVVFRPKAYPKIDFIKRVVGLPGDRIQMMDGLLYINGLQVQQERAGSFKDITADGTIKDIPRYQETLPNGKSYMVLKEQMRHPLDNTYEFVVPDKHYFLMGDNRDNSSDSRAMKEVGMEPEENIVGKAELILFSVDERTSIWKIWDWFWALRTDRLVKDIP